MLRLAVRQFFCGNPDCPAVSFAEQVDGLTARRARRSQPPARTLTAKAMAMASGRIGGRLAGPGNGGMPVKVIIRVIGISGESGEGGGHQL